MTIMPATGSPKEDRDSCPRCGSPLEQIGNSSFVHKENRLIGLNRQRNFGTYVCSNVSKRCNYMIMDGYTAESMTT
jgi:hypothetical protein